MKPKTDSVMTPEPHFDIAKLDADTILEEIMDVAAIGRNVPAILAENNIETAGELKEYLAVTGRELTDFDKVGEGTANKVWETTPGLYAFVFDREPETVDA